MTDGHMYTPPQPWPHQQDINDVTILACKHCGDAVTRWHLIDDYCRNCAELIIENLSPTDIAQVWQKLDERSDS